VSQTAGEFDVLVAAHRGELYAHCYRLLGSPHDAEHMTKAERDYAEPQDRGPVRAWLFRIVTNACLEQIEQRPRRILPPDLGTAYTQTANLGEPVLDQAWLEPLPGSGDQVDDAEETFRRREGVELAYVAALQHLPGPQRAALALGDVLDFSDDEVAGILDSSVDSVSSALADARSTMAARGPVVSQQQELSALGEDGVRILLGRFITAWQSADVESLSHLLAVDARFTMPPLPCWFDGRDAVLMYLTERAFLAPWRLLPITANAQPGLASFQAGEDGVFRLGGVNLLGLRDGQVAQIAGFLDPAAYAGFVLPQNL
jgi:RNA polymerase sigma-70 factor (TIGR02960 family)